MGQQWHQKISQCETQTIQGNDESKEWSDKKQKIWDLQKLQKYNY